MKTLVRAHKRKGTRGVKQHSRSIRRVGKSWKGEKYVHGPRKHAPSKYAEFRLGKPDKKGRRFVFGRIKGTNKWEIQSQIIPRNFNAWPFSKKEGYIMVPGFSGKLPKLTKKEKQKFEVKNAEKEVEEDEYLTLGSGWRILHWPSKTNVKKSGEPLTFEYPVQAERFIQKQLGGSRAFKIYKKK